MPIRTSIHRGVAAIALATFAGLASCSFAITQGQIDSFTVSANSWGNNAGSALLKTTDGADGPTDGYLEMITNGAGQGSSSRLIAIAPSSWHGDYIAEGVNAISLDANNYTDGDIYLRLAFRSVGDDTVFVTEEMILAPSSGWTSLTFDLAESNMERTGVSYTDTFSSVSQLRVIHRYDPSVGNGGPPDAADSVLGALGSPIAARVGIDNIQALGVPEPGTLALAALSAVAMMTNRRRGA